MGVNKGVEERKKKKKICTKKYTEKLKLKEIKVLYQKVKYYLEDNDPM